MGNQSVPVLLESHNKRLGEPVQTSFNVTTDGPLPPQPAHTAATPVSSSPRDRLRPF